MSGFIRVMVLCVQSHEPDLETTEWVNKTVDVSIKEIKENLSKGEEVI